MHIASVILVFANIAYVTSFMANRSPFSRKSVFKMCESEDGEEELDDVWGTPVGPMPSISSKYNFEDENFENMVHDLWIVGAGTLGTLIADIWQEMFPGMSIVTETRTDTRHESYLQTGKVPRLRSERNEADYKSAKHVIIAIPPSAGGAKGGSPGYLEEINEAQFLWAGPESGGTLTYTSSIGVYGDSLGNIVNEKFRLDTRSDKSTKLISAEEAVLRRGGSVMRLSGLYTESRGPHTFWLRKGAAGEVVAGAADGLINMLHYEDAAHAVVCAALTSPKQKKTTRFDMNNVEQLDGDGEVYIAVDDEPVSREEICRSALASGLFPSAAMPQFASAVGPEGKIVDSSITRGLIGWQPAKPSFRVFMRRLGGEEAEAKENKLLQKQEKASALWMPGVDGDDDDVFG